MLRLAIALFTPALLFGQCDDVEISSKEAKRTAEVVFQGTVESIRGTGVHRTVVFRVSRVWKGRVGSTFEMTGLETTGSMCHAFWEGLLTIGNELVVYASRPLAAGGIPDLFPMRGNTTLASRAKDVAALGKWRKPK